MSMARLRKAAVLLASVDAASASGLLNELTANERHALADELDERPPTFEEQQDIAREMTASLVGLERGRLSAAGAGSKPSQDRVNTRVPLEPRFAFLAGIEVATLARVLRLEHPQAIAVIASHLDSSAAAQVLRELSPEAAASTVRRLADLRAIDPPIEEELARALKRKLAGASRASAVSTEY
jgi:flagellar motor switch protein FliG